MRFAKTELTAQFVLEYSNKFIWAASRLVFYFFSILIMTKLLAVDVMGTQTCPFGGPDSSNGVLGPWDEFAQGIFDLDMFGRSNIKKTSIFLVWVRNFTKIFKNVENWVQKIKLKVSTGPFLVTVCILKSPQVT